MVKIQYENLFILSLHQDGYYYTFVWGLLSKDPWAKVVRATKEKENRNETLTQKSKKGYENIRQVNYGL